MNYENVGIIDGITVSHTRPVGVMRDPDLSRRVHEESDRLLRTHDCRQEHVTFGAFDEDLRRLDHEPEELLARLVDGWRDLIDNDPRILWWIGSFSVGTRTARPTRRPAPPRTPCAVHAHTLGGARKSLHTPASERTLSRSTAMHAGSEVQLTIEVQAERLLIQVRDSSPALPSLRNYGVVAVTGRGMQLVATQRGTRRQRRRSRRQDRLVHRQQRVVSAPTPQRQPASRAGGDGGPERNPRHRRAGLPRGGASSLRRRHRRGSTPRPLLAGSGGRTVGLGGSVH